MLSNNALDLNLPRVHEAMFHDRCVSAAAKRLRLTQPTIGNALSRLRDAFGDPLSFERAMARSRRAGAAPAAPGRGSWARPE